MAAILTVGYTPNYAGNHRICFKTTGDTYCCYNDDSGSVIGVEKYTEINLDDFELCLGTLPGPVGCAGSEVNGYVQPTCIDQTSDINRSPFIANFPSTACSAYSIECVESGIGEIGIINPGYGWPVGVVPTVTVNTSGSGFGFASTVTMSCLPGDSFCSIDSIVIDDSGEEYFYLNQLSVDISPLPSCVSNELLINGNFNDGFLNWNVIPPVDGWELTPSGVPYYNIPVYGSLGGTIEQTVLTPGKTYLIDFEKVTVEARSGTVRFIVSAGLFSIDGTGSNQYMITKTVGDPDFDGPLSITLTCFGSSVFSIYADSSTTDPLNTARLTEVSVVELCEVIDPELEIAFLDDCATFTVPNCDGSDNPTEYQIQGTQPYAINVCSGGAGPVGAKYTITPNPTYGVLGTELVVNGDFTTDLNGWSLYEPLNGQASWSPLYSGSVEWLASDVATGVYQNILTVGRTYTVELDLVINYNGSCDPVSEEITEFYIYAGTAVYGPLNFTGVQGFTFDITCTDNDQFIIACIDPNGCTSGMFCSFASVKEITDVPVSCCDCVKYDVINTGIASPIEFYYTDCLTQVITTESVDAGDTIQVCAVRNSIWAFDTNDNQNFEYIVSLVQDCQ